MEIPKFVKPALLVSGIALAACGPKPDFAETLNLKCKTNPDSRASLQVELRDGQAFSLANQVLTVTAPGRLRLRANEPDPEVQGSNIYIGGSGSDYRGYRYLVRQEALPNGNTNLVIEFNCANPTSSE